LGFLGASPFCCKGLAQERWIVLDFLGFSRPNRELFNGLRGLKREQSAAHAPPVRQNGAPINVSKNQQTLVKMLAFIFWDRAFSMGYGRLE
jgi:hypothetical protein